MAKLDAFDQARWRVLVDQGTPWVGKPPQQLLAPSCCGRQTEHPPIRHDVWKAPSPNHMWYQLVAALQPSVQLLFICCFFARNNTQYHATDRDVDTHRHRSDGPRARSLLRETKTPREAHPSYTCAVDNVCAHGEQDAGHRHWNDGVGPLDSGYPEVKGVDADGIVARLTARVCKETESG